MADGYVREFQKEHPDYKTDEEKDHSKCLDYGNSVEQHGGIEKILPTAGFPPVYECISSSSLSSLSSESEINLKKREKKNENIISVSNILDDRKKTPFISLKSEEKNESVNIVQSVGGMSEDQDDQIFESIDYEEELDVDPDDSSTDSVNMNKLLNPHVFYKSSKKKSSKKQIKLRERLN